MTKRPRVLVSIGVPILLAGVLLTVSGGSISPWLTLVFPVGVFVLGFAGISYLTHDEFIKLDAEQELHSGLPGDHRQHILRPEEHPYEDELARAQHGG